MALEDRRILGETQGEAVPSRYSANVSRAARVSQYGELLTQPLGKSGKYALCNEGSYYVLTNPTPGTGIAGIAAADGFDDTEALLHMRNDATEASGTRIYLDYLVLRCTAAGTNGTDFAYAMTLDTGATRYASGGSAITEVAPNMQNTATPAMTTYFGAVVPSTSTTDRLIAGGLLRPVIKVVGDTYTFDFGGSMGSAGMAVEGTAILSAVIPAPPVVLGPSDQFLFHEFASSQTVAASYEFEMGFWVR